MQKIFLWFYCLPISDALLLIVLATMIFSLLRKEYGNTPYWNKAILVLFVCWIAVVLFGTLGGRTEGSNMSEPTLTPFYSYYAALSGGSKELYRTNFMNAVLFYPAGLLGIEILQNPWKRIGKVITVTCIFALLSTGIEFIQYRFGLGVAEADDVIHNTLGAFLGAIACDTARNPHKK